MPPLSTTQRASIVSIALRIALCFVLLVLSAYAAASENGSWFDICSVPIVFVTTLLLTASIFVQRRELRTWTTTAVNLLLLALFAIFCYRDLWPLATFTLEPTDGLSSAIWTRGLCLALAAAFIPLATPRTYVPIDPSAPSDPSPEQIASPTSFLLFNFVSPLVWLGYQSDHLTTDMLPPVADNDRAACQYSRAFATLDPLLNKDLNHIFWPLLNLFRVDVFALALGITIRVITSFGSPIGLNRLLVYLETGGENAVVRPWVWISFLFFDPMFQSIGMQFYFWSANRLLVRMEAVITQLVFNHALRLPKGDGDTSSDDGSGEGKQGANLVGKVSNLVTSDLANITTAKDSLFLFLNVPLQVIICIWLLYALLGWSSIVGLAVMIICFPLPGWIATRLNFLAAAQMKSTDARIQQVTEVLGVIRMVKMFGWESRTEQQLAETRSTELTWLKRAKYTQLINDNLNHVIPVLCMISTYATFTLVMKRELTASIVFSSMLLFDMLRSQLESASAWMPLVISAKVSLDRLSEFLYHTKPLDRVTSPELGAAPLQSVGEIGFCNASFSWSSSPDTFRLTIPGRVTFLRGSLNIIAGSTASGKSSLLLALLGEMHFAALPGHDEAWYNLPTGISPMVAYVGQDSWLENRSIRENIVFDEPFDDDRYRKTLMQCALEPDLALFGAGDRTEVGEKGVTLSGGQRARIVVARAVYSSAPIVLLDDVLAALDAHTSKWIIRDCFAGDLLSGRTVILATHNVRPVLHLAKRVVHVRDGTVSIAEDLGQIIHEEEEENIADDTVTDLDANAKDEQKDKTDEQDADTLDSAAGKITIAEDVVVGRLQWPAMALYFHAFGGMIFWAVFFCSVFGSQLLKIAQTWFLGYWASLYETGGHVLVGRLLAQYSLLLLLGVVAYSVSFTVFVTGSVRASKDIHARLIASVLTSTFRWLDVTPTSRIITRCTSDMRSVDTSLTSLLSMFIDYSSSLLCKFVAVVVFSPVFAIPGAVIFGAGWKLGRIYMKAQMSVKRELNNARSPVLANFVAAMNGMVTVRAYGAQRRYSNTLVETIDNYTRCARAADNLSRWICIRIHGLGGLFAASFATFLVYGGSATGNREYDTGAIGFSLSLAISFAGMTLAWVLLSNMVEAEANSLERIMSFLNIDHEPETVESRTPPAYWPASGDLRAEHLDVRYSKDGPLVLRDLSFDIRSGERIGIVGRTGAGKSSLALALLRCIPVDGKLWYDDRDTDPLRTNLSALRSNITVIPQQPDLFVGTLRSNLDPFGAHEDVTLHDVLQSVRLPLPLDSAVSSGGDNLSVGQRQMVAIARALLRRSKIVILDEATAGIDHETDVAIQRVLRQELVGMTLLTIAHRLRTIADYDRIMVLHEGRLVEFDSPRVLYANEDSYFRSLVLQSSDKDELETQLS